MEYKWNQDIKETKNRTQIGQKRENIKPSAFGMLTERRETNTQIVI
jgi:hypothetical protein